MRFLETVRCQLAPPPGFLKRFALTSSWWPVAQLILLIAVPQTAVYCAGMAINAAFVMALYEWSDWRLCRAER